MKAFFLCFVLVSSFDMRNCAIPEVSDAQNWANDLETELGKVNQEHNLDYYTKLWLEECERVNGTEAIEEIQGSFVQVTDCITAKVNLVNISDEIKDAMPRGALDEVFAKYCNQLPEIKDCRAPMIKAVQVCLTDQADQDLEIFDAVLEAALNFVCYKGGERIAIFLAENGTDCFQYHLDQIAECLNGHLPQLQKIVTDIHTANISIFHEDNCDLEAKMKTCVVEPLKTCSDPTPANVIEGLIDSMLKKTPCYKGGSARTWASSSLTLTLTGAFIIVSRFMFDF